MRLGSGMLLGPAVATSVAAIARTITQVRCTGDEPAEGTTAVMPAAVPRGRDVVVVGGGVCGLSTALHLARDHGARVVVIERETVGAPTQASSVNCGHISAADGLPDYDADDLVQRLADEAGHERPLARGLNDVLIAGSKAIYRALHSESRAPGGIEFAPAPEMWVAETEEHARWAKRRGYPTAREFGGAAAIARAGWCRGGEVTAGGRLVPSTGVWLEPHEAKQLEPALGSVSGAVLLTATATAHPRKATLALADAARRAGVAIVENAEVYQVTRASGPEVLRPPRWRVRARVLRHRLDDPEADGDGTVTVDVEAGTLVLAAGGWVPALASLVDERLRAAVPVVPVIGQMWSTAPLEQGSDAKATPRLRHLIGSMRSTLDWQAVDTSAYPGNPPCVTHTLREPSAGSVSWRPRHTRHLYGKPTPDGRVIFGGDRRVHPPQGWRLAHPLPRIIDDAHAVCHAHAASVIPQLQHAPVERQWGGIMPFSIDGAPIIGVVPLPSQRLAAPARSSLYVVSGLGASGFMKGPMAGKLLAAVIADDGRWPADDAGEEGEDGADAKPPQPTPLVQVAREVLVGADPARFSSRA